MGRFAATVGLLVASTVAPTPTALAGEAPSPPALRRAEPQPHVIYLNFSDGTESFSRADVDDATANETVLGGVSPYPEFIWPNLATPASRTQLVREVATRVHRAFLPYNVLVTTRRPGAGRYTMVVVGGSPTVFGYDAKVAGLAFMDCEDQQDANVVFAFPGPLRGSLPGLTVTIAQEAAHAFGLEHTSDPGDIMFPRVEATQTGFADRESDISGERLCGRETQNSHRLLLARLGPWTGDDKPLGDDIEPDQTPPVVRIDQPTPGAVVTQPFTLQVAVEDDDPMAVVEVLVQGRTLSGSAPPFAWSLDGFEPGPLTVVVTARDTAGNTGQATVDLIVEGPASRSGGCSLAHRGASGLPAGLLLAVLVVALWRRDANGACGGARRRL